MRHISELLQEHGRWTVADELGEDASSADPYTFDVVCQRCGTVFDTRQPWCPQCEDIRTGELPVGW